MKLEQPHAFEPISVVLQTREEAKVFWSIMRKANSSNFNLAERNIAIILSELFFSKAHL